MKFKAVIFDLFGTLVEPSDPAGDARQMRKTSSILKLEHEKFIKLYDETFERQQTGGFKTINEYLVFACQEFGAPVKASDIDYARIDWLDYLIATMAPRRHAGETLTELKKKNKKIALLSNCTMDVSEIWPRISIAKFFDITIFSSECGLQKPDPGIYKLTLENLSVKPEECLFIDDNIENLEAAKRAGITSVLIRFHGETNPPPGGKPAETPPAWQGLTITALPEVLDILERAHE